MFYDFRKPDQLPYKEIGRAGEITGSDGWLDNKTFQIQRENTLRKSDGADYDDLSKAEQEKIDKGETEVEYQSIKVEVARPPLDDAA